MDSLYVLSQVRLKHFDEARAEVNAGDEADRNWLQSAIVECSAGNVAAGAKALDALLVDDDEYDLSDTYSDPDLGPALAKPEFADWRKKHPKPMPATQPATLPDNDD